MAHLSLAFHNPHATVSVSLLNQRRWLGAYDMMVWNQRHLKCLTRPCSEQVNVSELGLVTPGGKVVWGKYAQVTNNPENDGCINAVLLV